MTDQPIGGNQAMARWKRLLLSVLRIAAGVPIVSVWGGGMLLVIFSATWRGRAVGLSAATLTGAAFFAVGYWHHPWFRRVRSRALAIVIPTGLLLYTVPMLLAPDGGRADASARNCFLRQRAGFVRYSPGNVIPEVDQLKVGMHLLPLSDPDMAEATRLRSLVLPLYAEMDRDPEFRALGSTMGSAYRELFRFDFRTGHYYVVLPEKTRGAPFPCLIFLHGMGGNMKACLWVLAELARNHGCVVIAPTFGFGNWDRPDGARLTVAVTREAMATLPIDRRRIFLMGYSNGAMGVTRAAVKEPKLYRGLVYLSPVTEDEFFSSSAFSTRKAGRRVLFIHGGCDKRIPRTFVEGTAATLKHLGHDVRIRVYEEEDHYLLFSRPDAVLGDIRELIELCATQEKK